MNTIKLLFVIILVNFTGFNSYSQELSNKLPMYGEVPKTEEYKKIDDEFITSTIATKGSREKGCEQMIQRAWAYFYHDSLELSMKRFNQAWLLDPSNPDPYFGFAALTEIQDNTNAAALRYYKLGMEKDIHHDHAEKCYKKIADCKEELKDYNGTIKAYEAIVAMNNQNVFAYKKLGYFYSEVDKDDAALKNYTKAIELDSKDANTYNNRGFLYQKLHNNTKAIEDYSIAIKLEPEYTSAYANRGLTKMEGGNVAGAKTDFEMATKLDPKSGQLRRLLGLSKSTMKDLEGACSDFKIAAELGDPDAAELVQKYVITSSANGRLTIPKNIGIYNENDLDEIEKQGDFWDNLPAHVKEDVEEALKQSERGEGKPHEEVMNKYDQWRKNK